MSYNRLPVCLSPEEIVKREDNRVIQLILDAMSRGMNSVLITKNISEQLTDALITRNYTLIKPEGQQTGSWLVKWNLDDTVSTSPDH